MTDAKPSRRPSPRGFTLVEILIVVIILGILAAIVIPQFSTASQDARRSSLNSQLQTVRSQLNLYAVQHRDSYPPALVAGGANAWADMVVKTNVDHTTTGAPALGPYLQASPANNLNGSYIVDASITTDLGFGGGVNPGSAAAGWLFNPSIGKIWATSTKGGYVYNESNPNDPNNTQQ